MFTKLSSAVLETLYTTVIVFIYYYSFRTLIQLQPFSVGFNPPSNVEQLFFAFMSILGMVACLKIGQSFFFSTDTEQKPAFKASYIPSNRKMI